MANSVRKYRLKAGMSQMALAVAAGLTERTVRRVENGEAGLRAYEKVGEALGKPVDVLLAKDPEAA